MSITWSGDSSGPAFHHTQLWGVSDELTMLHRETSNIETEGLWLKLPNMEHQVMRTLLFRQGLVRTGKEGE